MFDWNELDIAVNGKTSGQLYTICPKCSRDRKKKSAKCLSVQLDIGVFNCNHCGWSGKAKSDGIRSFAPRKTKYVKPNYVPIKTELIPKIIDWFNKRKIDQEIVTKYGIEFRMKYIPQHEKEVGCIAFPYFVESEIVNVKYRDGCKHFTSEANCERVFYGYDDIDVNLPLYICEGEIDKLSIATAGIHHCVSVPNGASEKEFYCLSHAEEKIRQIKHFIISVDNDAPGKILEGELIRRLGPEKCSVITWPDGCKDANDTLVTHGPEILRQLLENSSPVPISGIYSVEELYPSIFEYWKNGLKPGPAVNIGHMPDYYRPRPGELTVVTGIPGSGKSTFVDWLTIQLGIQYDWKFGMFSPENQPIQRHAATLIQMKTNKSFHDVEYKLSFDDLNNGCLWLDEHYRFILPEKNSSLNEVLRLAKIAVFRFGCNGIVIDPWNELEHVRPREMSETEYVSQCLTLIKQFARETHTHLWLIAHPTKLQKNSKGEYPVPTMYDILGSSNFRNKADMGLSIWREMNSENPNYSTVEIHVQKVRFRENGRIGVFELNFDPLTGNYYG